jgi:hypothetical protein
MKDTDTNEKKHYLKLANILKASGLFFLQGHAEGLHVIEVGF